MARSLQALRDDPSLAEHTWSSGGKAPCFCLQEAVLHVTSPPAGRRERQTPPCRSEFAGRAFPMQAPEFHALLGWLFLEVTDWIAGCCWAWPGVWFICSSAKEITRIVQIVGACHLHWFRNALWPLRYYTDSKRIIFIFKSSQSRIACYTFSSLVVHYTMVHFPNQWQIWWITVHVNFNGTDSLEIGIMLSQIKWKCVKTW